MPASLILRASIALLSLAGLVNAFYFTFAYYGRIKKARWVPEILCAREGSSCVTVVQTPYGRVFGVPNSLLGILYYLVLIGWDFSGASFGPTVMMGGHGVAVSTLALVAASAGTVLLGFYLIYALIEKLHTHCPLCYLGHAINATLLFLLVASIW
jgi:uncharacterized membrane protein